MKKLTLIALVCAMCLTSCSYSGTKGDGNVTTDAADIPEAVTTAAVTEANTDPADVIPEYPDEERDPEMSKGVSSKEFTDAEGCLYNIEYNKNGDIVKEKCIYPPSEYYEGEISIIYTCEYNKDGLIIEKNRVGYGGEAKNVYFYNGGTKILREDVYKSSLTTVTAYVIYEYDENDNKIKETWHSVKGHIEKTHDFTYENGVLTHSTERNLYPTGKLDSMYECDYDAKGNVTVEREYNGKENLIGRTEFEYNANGIKTRETEYDLYENYNVREFWSNGETKLDTSYFKDGTIDYIKAYRRDGSTEYYTQYEDGKPSYTEYYDAKGNVTSEKTY